MFEQPPALILAGGLGTRLRSVISNQPKPLAPVAGRPFLAYLLDHLAAQGLQKAMLLTAHLGEQVEAAFGPSHGTLSLHYLREVEPLGTAGALRQALQSCSGERFFVFNGDSFHGVDLAAFSNHHLASGMKGTLVVLEQPDTSTYGRVELGEGDRVAAFKEKTKTEGPGWINAGIYLLEREILEIIPPDRPVSIERECFPSWLGRLGAFRSQGPFLDIGTPERYAQAESFFRRGQFVPTKGGV